MGSTVLGAGLQKIQAGMLRNKGDKMERREGPRVTAPGAVMRATEKGRRVTEPRSILSHLGSVLTFDL